MFKLASKCSRIQDVSRVQQWLQANRFSTDLWDTFGRKHDYLRISLTERCNLRCFYCMPEEGVQLTPNQRLLSMEETFRLANIFVQRFGVKKIRLTGGEPLVRKDIIDIVQKLNSLKQFGLKHIAITTNGITFARHSQKLYDAGLDSVNISLDTLKPEKFQMITRRNGLNSVLKSIDAALALSFESVKINFVPIRNVNDDEILDFVDLTKEKNLEVRFIEYMPFDGNRWSMEKMVSFQQLYSSIAKHYGKDMCEQMPPKTINETAKSFRVKGHIGTVGFISSMTNAFCSTCNRVRLTADGHLKVCLFGKEEISLKDALREGCNDEQICQMIIDSVRKKKKQHAGAVNIAKSINRPMILIAPKVRYQLRAYSTGTNNGLTHIDTKTGKSKMVDIGAKAITSRMAHASSVVHVGPDVLKLIKENNIVKGDVLSVARTAGIMGSKWTGHLIPLCHQIPLDHVQIEFQLDDDKGLIVVDGWCRTTYKTGVEMEAMMAVSIAALTIYDMCKAVNKAIIISQCRLIEKRGGKSDFNVNKEQTN